MENDIINNLPIHYEANEQYRFNDLFIELNNCIRKVTIKNYINAQIDYILFTTADENAIYLDHLINEIHYKFNQSNLLVFNLDERILINRIMSIVNSSNRNEKKVIYNLLNI